MIPRRASPKRVNRARKAKNLLRAHGPAERRAWMKAQPCVVCGRTPSDAAHIRTGGTGRKSDADQTVPLCSNYWGQMMLNGSQRHTGHHRELDHGPGRRAGFEQRHNIDLTACAAQTEAKWLAFLDGGGA